MTTSPSEDSGTLQHQVSGASSAELDPSIPIRGPEHISYEEGPWANKTVLSFDGGGVRGYSSLLVLKRIMIRIRELERNHEEYRAYSSESYRWNGAPEENIVEDNPESDRVDRYLPCHYFDYVAGTSTGGLSSIMLGRLRMSVDQALDTYKSFGNAVFGKPRVFHERSWRYYPRAKFSSRKTHGEFQKLIYEALQREKFCFYSEAEVEPLNLALFGLLMLTNSIAISWSIKKDGGVSKEFVWRSYDNEPSPKEPNPMEPRANRWNPSNAGPAHTTAIWEVARATTAAPGYFESIKIIGRKFLDGGMAANNPSLMALREINNLHGLVPDLFVSIGTGLKPSQDDQNNDVLNIANGHTGTPRRDTIRDGGRRKQFVKKWWEIGKNWKDWMVDCEGGPMGTNAWRDRCDAIQLTDSYRLNVEGDLHTIPLDDWRPSNTGKDSLDFIEEQTRQYLTETRVVDWINSIASKAVEIRRQRAATEQWERFAVDVVYRCTDCENKKYDTRAQLREHLQKGIAHREDRIADGKQLEERLNDSRSFKPKRPVETRR
ncbi:Calcium-independent phospholipase A2-gamma [Fusarium agapanthi]|uniref:Calcium-independent phospholipase A2-gamma n=1 Tax=Fusarium agapanthi TaxID=1803897 RepID=A0A9P5AXE6_9HYPO|nr:Calcium-independent phospholipase A2-gamma [Fusarium agapanthi]